MQDPKIEAMMAGLDDPDAGEAIPTEVPNEDPVKETPPATDPTPTTPNEGDEGGEGDEQGKQKPAGDNRVIKELRQAAREAKQEADRTHKTLERISKASGFDTVEAYLEDLDKKDVEQAASTKNISPELEKELRELRAIQAEHQAEQQKQNFYTKMNELKSNMQLTDDELMDFAKAAQESGINLIETSISTEKLYKALNFDALVTKAREDERNKVLEEVSKQSKGVRTTTGTGSGGNQNKGIADLYKDIANQGIK